MISVAFAAGVFVGIVVCSLSTLFIAWLSMKGHRGWPSI